MDVAFSSLILLLTLPLLILLAVGVKLSSPGPVLFCQERVGKHGRLFRILKFRSMRAGGESGSQITSRGDKRVTWFGGLLRRTKLDELPQLWNVLKGNMSLVGPRPEVPQYVRMYSPEQREVLSVSPGITDLASIKYRHEEAILGGQADPQKFYVEQVMPHKLRMNLAYVQNMSFFGDLRTLLLTGVAALRLHVGEDFASCSRPSDNETKCPIAR